MKNLGRTVKTAIVGGLASIAAASATGCAGLNAPFKSFLNSTEPQRRLMQEEKFAEETMRKGRVQDGHVLYVKMEDAGRVLKNEFGVDIANRTFTANYEDIAIKVSYIDPRTETERTDVQTISHDCTIDTDFGRVNACVNNAELDDAITAKAKLKGVDNVVVTTQYHPMSEQPTPFLGVAHALVEIDGKLAPQTFAFPANSKVHSLLLNSPIADAKYVLNVMNVANGHGGEIDRVVAVADYYACLSGKVTAPLGNRDVVMLTGATISSNYRDLRGSAREIGGFFNDLTGASDAIQAAHYSFDRGFRGNYLDRNVGHDSSGLENTAKAIGEVQGVTGGLVGLKGDVGALSE